MAWWCWLYCTFLNRELRKSERRSCCVMQLSLLFLLSEHFSNLPHKNWLMLNMRFKKKKKKILGSFIPRFSLCLGYVCEWNISSLGWAPSEFFLPIFSAIITHWFHIIMLILILRVGGRGSLCSVVSLKLLQCCLKELWLCCISFQASSGIIFPPVLPSQCDSCLSALWALN